MLIPCKEMYCAKLKIKWIKLTVFFKEWAHYDWKWLLSSEGPPYTINWT